MSSSIPWPGTPARRRDAARRRRLRAFSLRHRRALAAMALAMAVLCALRVVSPAPPRRTTVWVAARDLALGAVLGTGDLRTAAWAPDSVPAGVLPPDRALGRTLGGPLRRGEPVTDVRLIGSGLLTGRSPGLVATTVRVGDPAAAAIVRPGDRVDVLSSSAALSPAGPVATAALVLAVPAADRRGGGLLGGSGDDDPRAGVLVLGVTADVARRLALSTSDEGLGSGGLTVALRHDVQPPDVP